MGASLKKKSSAQVIDSSSSAENLHEWLEELGFPSVDRCSIQLSQGCKSLWSRRPWTNCGRPQCGRHLSELSGVNDPSYSIIQRSARSALRLPRILPRASHVRRAHTRLHMGHWLKSKCGSTSWTVVRRTFSAGPSSRARRAPYESGERCIFSRRDGGDRTAKRRSRRATHRRDATGLGGQER